MLYQNVGKRSTTPVHMRPGHSRGVMSPLLVSMYIKLFDKYYKFDLIWQLKNNEKSSYNDEGPDGRVSDAGQRHSRRINDDGHVDERVHHEDHGGNVAKRAATESHFEVFVRVDKLKLQRFHHQQGFHRKNISKILNKPKTNLERRKGKSTSWAHIIPWACRTPVWRKYRWRRRRIRWTNKTGPWQTLKIKIVFYFFNFPFLNQLICKSLFTIKKTNLSYR